MKSGLSSTKRVLTGWICASCEKKLSPQQSCFPVRPARGLATLKSKARLPESPVRTRFAPSPTGDLHLGSVRTALYNYLLARRTGGKFLLRIEDTDQKRTIPGAEDRLFDDLRWLGLEWDEGPVVGGPHGPYRQSERIKIYHEYIKPLLEDEKAYMCFCSEDRIHELNESRHEQGLMLGYDRKCADIPPETAMKKAAQGQPYVIRFRVPNQWPSFQDLTRGTVRRPSTANNEGVYEDPVLIKSDGFPTYHFANVVDDQLMRITHVIRGQEWVVSTHLHVALYNAFGWTPPAFLHVPLLVNQNRQKLSKRENDIDVASYRKQGVLPEALNNFAVLLGWSHQERTDDMSMQQMENLFDLKITKGSAMVTFTKLPYLMESHVRRRLKEGGERYDQLVRDVASALLETYGAGKIIDLVGNRKFEDVVAMLLRTRSLRTTYTSHQKFAENVAIFFKDPTSASSYQNSAYRVPKIIPVAAATLCLVPEESWTREVHSANLEALDLAPPRGGVPELVKQSKKDLWHYLRQALLGGAQGPSIPETMEILGRDKCLQRIQAEGAKSKLGQTLHTQTNIRVGVAETAAAGG